MKICFLCDIHLPYRNDTTQFKALDYALKDAAKKSADLCIVAGDYTAAGDLFAKEAFFRMMDASGIPYLFIPGNSDLRNPETKEALHALSSPLVNAFEELTVFAVNDSDRTVSKETLEVLKRTQKNDIVFMHHPIEELTEPSRTAMRNWRDRHPGTLLVAGHVHVFEQTGSTVLLNALDPDKGTGEGPSFYFYDTETKAFETAYYFCPVPTFFSEYCGISCYDPYQDLIFAKEHHLSSVELRPSAVSLDRDRLKALILDWREAGGKNLSVHAPDIRFGPVTKASGETEDDFLNPEAFEKFAEFARFLSIDRATLHVPNATVEVTKRNENLEKIAAFAAAFIEKLPPKCVIGIENMHMHPQDPVDERRGFGFIPEEVRDFMLAIREAYTKDTGLAPVLSDGRLKIGYNLDAGHARNNIPFSEKYSLGAWHAELGRDCVGYHIHQIDSERTPWLNHTPITELYGKLISYASFFDGLRNGTLRKAPVIFEIREGSYEPTVDLFEKEASYQVADLHSHTWYSNCGRDDPEVLIETAIRNGISTLGITDHSYGIADRKETYLREMRALAEKYKDRITIRVGIEIPSIPETYDFYDGDFSCIKDYDYCLIEHITYENSLIGPNLFNFCEKTGIRCGIAHTDLFGYCKMYGFDPKEFFREMGKRRIFWEMNVSYDSIHRYHKHAYVEDFFNDLSKQFLVIDSGTEVSVGFDSHRAEDYDGHRVHEAYRFLKDNGFTLAEP